jgi:outer membrane beta-barrel protein
MERIFLSRDGKSFGPFSTETIEAMRAKGELSAYQWIYDDPALGWRPLAPPPPAPTPVPQPEASQVQAESQTPAAAQATPTHETSTREWLAVIHDGRTLVSGVAHSTTSRGCTISANAPQVTLPTFRPGARLSLNLLDPQTNQAENMKITVEAVERGNHGWEYKVSWSKAPQLTALLMIVALQLGMNTMSVWAAPPAQPANPQQLGAAAPAGGAKKLDVDGLKEKYWNNESSPELRVVQNRTYTKELKVSVQPFFNLISADPFQSTLGAGFELGFNPTEYLGMHAIYSRVWNSPTSAADAFLTKAGFAANSNPIQHLIGGEVSWSILYGKLSLIGKAILHFDLYLHGGAGYLFTDNGNTVTPWAGLGQQIYIFKWMTLKADYRFMYWRENVVNKYEVSATAQPLGTVLGQRNVFAHWFAIGLNFLFP